MAPSDSLTSKNIDLDTKIVILSALVQKLWSKTSIFIMVAEKQNLQILWQNTSNGQEPLSSL